VCRNQLFVVFASFYIVFALFYILGKEMWSRDNVSELGKRKIQDFVISSWLRCLRPNAMMRSRLPLDEDGRGTQGE
jgi:hypothetical protein